MGLLHAKTTFGPRTARWEQVSAALGALPALPELKLPDLSALTDATGLTDLAAMLGPEVVATLTEAVTAGQTQLLAAVNAPLAAVNSHLQLLTSLRSQTEGQLAGVLLQIEQAEQAVENLGTIPGNPESLTQTVPALAALLSLAQTGAQKGVSVLPRLQEQAEILLAKLEALETAQEDAQARADGLFASLEALQQLITQLTGGP